MYSFNSTNFEIQNGTLKDQAMATNKFESIITIKTKGKEQSETPDAFKRRNSIQRTPSRMGTLSIMQEKLEKEDILSNEK